MDRKFILIPIIEIIFMLYININVYKGVIPVFGLFVVLILFKVIVYYNHIKTTQNHNIKFLLISIIIIGLFIINLPQYTYSECKNLIYQNYGNSIEILEHKYYYKNTVPVKSSSNILEINRAYYFPIIFKNNIKKYYIVNPANGEIIQLKEPYEKLNMPRGLLSFLAPRT